MKKNKLILCLILILFLTSGCSVNYELEIYNDKANEKISGVFPEALSDNIKPSEYVIKELMKTESSSTMYFRKTKNTSSTEGISKYSTNFKDYANNLTGIITCYDLYKVNEYDDVITILTSDKFNCFEYYPELEQVTVMIKSNHKLIETNADRVDGYRYYWTIDKVTSDNEKILLKLDSNKKIFNYEGEFVKKVILICGFAVIIIGSATISYKRLKKRNARINQI